jgi:hypothetical protein
VKEALAGILSNEIKIEIKQLNNKVEVLWEQ